MSDEEKLTADLLLHVLHAFVLSVNLLCVLLEAILVHIERTEREPPAID